MANCQTFQSGRMPAGQAEVLGFMVKTYKQTNRRQAEETVEGLLLSSALTRRSGSFEPGDTGLLQAIYGGASFPWGFFFLTG